MESTATLAALFVPCWSSSVASQMNQDAGCADARNRPGSRWVKGHIGVHQR